MSHVRRFVVVGLLLLVCALPAAAQQMHWNMIGAGANIEPTSMSLATFSRMAITFNMNAFGTIYLRYPVTNVYGTGLSTVAPWSTLQAAYTPNSGIVSLTLMQVDRCSKTQTPLCTIYQHSSDTKVQCDTCTWSGNLDFGSNLYYVEAYMTRSTGAGYPRIESLSIY